MDFKCSVRIFPLENRIFPLENRIFVLVLLFKDEFAGGRQEEPMQSVVSAQVNLSARCSYTIESFGFTHCADSILFFCID